MLARLVFTNQYNQLVLDKKIKATEKKYAANLAALRLVRFWKNQSSNLNPTKDKMAKQTPEQENQLVKAITSKAITENMDGNIFLSDSMKIKPLYNSEILPLLFNARKKIVYSFLSAQRNSKVNNV